MSELEPLVSIIIPCYNHERFVQDCIQSIINQTYNNIELIIIDDGSKDNSVKAIEELVTECQNRFVRFEFKSRPNKGLSSTLNEALEWVEGKYISTIASDDMLIADKTAIQVDYLEHHSKTVAVFGSVNLIENNNIVGSIKAQLGSTNFKSMMLEGNRLLAPTQMIRSDAMLKTGGYKEDILIEDTYMWLKLSEVGDLYALEKTFALYRRHESNTSINLKKMHKAKFQVISEFKHSEYYSAAVKRVKWSNNFDYFASKKYQRPYYLAKMFYIDPIRTVKKLINIIFKENT